MLQKLQQLGISLKNQKMQVAVTDTPLAGQTFLFTGTMPTLKRNEAEKLAEDNGGKLLSSVSNNLNYLVAGESAGSKLEKAKKIKSINIISEQDFLNMIQG